MNTVDRPDTEAGSVKRDPWDTLVIATCEAGIILCVIMFLLAGIWTAWFNRSLIFNGPYSQSNPVIHKTP